MRLNQENCTVKRSNCGNMLVLSGVFMLVAALATMLALSLCGVLFAYNRLQTTADELAITGARKLNELDRAGQMNNMIARSRQLVFSSREQTDISQSQFPHLVELAQNLLDEARDGAVALDEQRVHVRSLNQVEVESAVQDKFNELKQRHALVLPWLKVNIPEAPVIHLGKIDQVESNCRVLEGIEELNEIDSSASVSDAQSRLYKGDINPKLSGADADLNFKLSSLPAPVENTIAPARATLANAFRDVSSDQLQSCVQVQLKLEVETVLGATASGKIQCTGTALTTGAKSMQ